MFAHLHLHTEFSLLDGACRIEPVILAAKARGQTSIAITDHGVMYGAVDFYKCAKKHGINPIIGCEVYVAPNSRFDRDKVNDKKYYHLILLCKNEVGYKNLIKMVSQGFTEGFYAKPRIDHELLTQHHEGLICLSACLAGEIPQAILNNDYAKAKETALWYRDVFGEDNYYLEIQDHGIKEQKIVNEQIYKISSETGIPLVATNDTHYVEQEDHIVQQVLICIQTNHVLGEDTGLEFHSKEFYLKSEEEMKAVFPSHLEAIENAGKIADMCNMEFDFSETKLPYFEVPNGEDHFQYFKRQCFDGLIERYGEDAPTEYVDRLNYELETINKMGYTDYYLIVSDFVNYAKNKGIPVGPGRGSGVGSIASYCIGITSVDPMEYNLLFERFLNPERVSMPDFDIDFCYERRSEVIEYVVNKYGRDHVAQIVTFGTLAARAAIRDCGRAMGVPYATVDAVAKLIPTVLNISIERAVNQSPDLQRLCETNSEINELVSMAKRVEGMPRNTSTHAAGVVITRDPVYEYVPLSKNDDLTVTQYIMTTLEELGLLKMDFLGLRTLTVIDYAEKAVKKFKPDFDIEKIPLNDEKVMELFWKGQTDGIFQFESAGMKRMLIDLDPTGIEDLIAATSLYRPGPADQIDKYIANRHQIQTVKDKTPLLKNILSTTYGCIIYQEQVMQIFRELAGYSYGKADIVRRAMSKKKLDVLKKERNTFIYGHINDDGSVECPGAVKRGIDEKTANSIFDEMLEFGKYAFNKSHAAAYTIVAYRTAYLKAHYPAEFMAALLTSVLDNSNKVAKYIGECKRLGLSLSTPDINTSMQGFASSGRIISYGLLGIKNLGSDFIRKIIKERSDGSYTDIYDFCSRLQGKEFNKRAVESLIFAGAMDGLGANRKQMLQALPSIVSGIEYDRKRNIEGQVGFFDLTAKENTPKFEYPNVEEYSHSELLKMEKEITGLYLSGHPMDRYKKLLEGGKFDKISDLLEAEGDVQSKYKDAQSVSIVGIINSVTSKTTKTGGIMAFVTVEDTGGVIEIIVFPKILSACEKIVGEGKIVVVNGKLTMEENKEPEILAQSVADASKITAPNNRNTKNNEKESQSSKKAKRKGLFLRFVSKDSQAILMAKGILEGHSGNVPLYFYYEDEKKYDFRGSDSFVDANPEVLSELVDVLGKSNVVLN